MCGKSGSRKSAGCTPHRTMNSSPASRPASSTPTVSNRVFVVTGAAYLSVGSYDDTMTSAGRRTGAETRAEAQRVALDLFIDQGYEATSLRQIADRLGINKASLYYHFENKEAIISSVMAGRGDEAEELLRWAREQPTSPDLL